MSESKFHTLWEQYGRVILGLFVLAMIVHDIFGRHGFMAMQKTKRDIAAVQANIGRLNKENTQLAERIHDLQTNPVAIEELGRDLGLVRKDEVIIKNPTAPQ